MIGIVRKRILYVEDETALCELFTAVMEPLGYSVDTAQIGQDGIDMHAANSYDMVALDYQLPDMTGLDIAKKFLTENQDLPVIMITGRGNEKVAAEALRLGVSNYIVKDSKESYIELLPSVVAHLEKRAEIVNIMRASAEALSQAEAESKQQFFTQLDAAERYESQAHELAVLAEELTAANERLSTSATTDELTGLANFRLCQDRLKVAIATARRNDCEVALIHVDLDNFKVINSVAGRSGGDSVLRQIAERLKGCVRDMDTVARLRSDRFGLIVSNFDDRDTVVTVAQRVQDCLSTPFKAGDVTVPVAVRIGIAVYPEHGSTGNDLFDHAELSVHDAAIYRAAE